MKKGKGIKILILLLAALLTMFFYVLFHELGHAIVMISEGAEILEFSILGAHVSATPGNYTDISDLWLNANGAFLPVVLSLIYGLFYRKECTNLFYRCFSYLVALVPVASLFAWVVIPMLYLQGQAPANDDVTKFLYNFSQDYHPLLVSGAALLMIACGVWLMMRKRIIKNMFESMK